MLRRALAQKGIVEPEMSVFNGVFTYSILEALNKYPSIKISELKKIVGERVEQLTKGLQQPTSRSEVMVVDWSLIFWRPVWKKLFV